MKKIKYNKISDYKYEISKSFDKGMNVPAVFYASKETLNIVLNDNSLNQLINVSKLPGIVKYALAMPDVHQGYGFPIGGVAAFDYEDGIISPGGVGYDINCGVRLLKSNLKREEIASIIKNLTMSIYSLCPCGTGRGSAVNVSEKELKNILRKGAKWALNNGYASQSDLTCIEDNGTLEASLEGVSKRAIERGSYQVGSLGSGNHFIEIDYIEKVFNQKKADQFGIQKNDVMVQVHCGSRGLGHQVCKDHLQKLHDYSYKHNLSLPDNQLVYALFNSEEGKSYYHAMNAAANFAFVNRQVLTHFIRIAFEKNLEKMKKPVFLNLIYDITHNIAKVENHVVNGKTKKLLVHRKGATRSFGPGNKILGPYEKIGQPVLVPGSMGTYSYLLTGTEKAMNETFGSSCHGAGRTMSRRQARKSFDFNSLLGNLKRKNIFIQAKSKKGASEEAPGAYKNVNSVVDIITDEGIAEKIVRLKPMAVIKG